MSDIYIWGIQMIDDQLSKIYGGIILIALSIVLGIFGVIPGSTCFVGTIVLICFGLGCILLLLGIIGLVIAAAKEKPAGPTQYICRKCGDKIHWIPDHNAWYCYKCKKYVQYHRDKDGTITDDGKHWLDD